MKELSNREAKILAAAQKVYGTDRILEVFSNDGDVDLRLVMRVVEKVTNPHQEMTIERAEEHHFEGEVGDELMFQIFFEPHQWGLARAFDSEYGELLAIDTENGAKKILNEIEPGLVEEVERAQQSLAELPRVNEHTAFYVSSTIGSHRSSKSGLAAVTSFLESEISSACDSLTAIRIHEHDWTEEVILVCRDKRVAAFAWNGETLTAFFEEAPKVLGPAHGVIDSRWQLIYFVPDNAFRSKAWAIDALNRYFVGEPMISIDVPQNTEEHIAVYEQMKRDGKIEE